jgi:hypothetical protein
LITPEKIHSTLFPYTVLVDVREIRGNQAAEEIERRTAREKSHSQRMKGSGTQGRKEAA